jgi:hypothetical protein
MKYGLNQLWPTSVLLEKIENTELLNLTTQEIIQTIDLQHPPSDFQNYDVINDGGEILHKFRDKIVLPLFEKYVSETFNLSLYDYDFFLRSWLAGSGHSYQIDVHNHSGASVSAVFYLLCEEENKGGELVLTDPRVNANRGYLIDFNKIFDNAKLSPTTGDAILFPGFVYHYTHIFKGNLRLAMPVDLHLANK